MPISSEPICTERVSADGVGGAPLILHSTADPGRVKAYLGLRGKQRMPDDPKALFWTALREAVGLHYASLLPYQVPEERRVEDDHAQGAERRVLLQEQLDIQLAIWTRAFQDDPGAHGALYNAALVHILRGQDEQALPLLRRAFAVRDWSVYRETLDETLGRVNARNRVRKHGLPASERDERASTILPDWLPSP